MLAKVPGAKSSEGFPAMVTRPAFTGCLNLTMASPHGDKPPPIQLD
jgi:hypothetical protein